MSEDAKTRKDTRPMEIDAEITTKLLNAVGDEWSEPLQLRMRTMGDGTPYVESRPLHGSICVASGMVKQGFFVQEEAARKPGILESAGIEETP